VARVGIDVGGTKCLGVAVAGGEVVAEQLVPTPGTKEPLLDTLAGLVRSLGEEAGEAVTGVGLGVPGLVDRAGVLHFAPNLLGATGVAVKAEMEARLGLEVDVDNDATCAAWGERELGAARGFDEVVLVTLGTGIGGGIVSGGRVVRGANGFGGEIGHMVVDPHGPQCPCGRRGCWERYASGSGLGWLGREAAVAGRAPRLVELAGGDAAAVRGEDVSVALGEGDAGAVDVLTEFAWWLAIGLANLANIFDPQAFVLGGGVVAIGDVLFDAARAAFARTLTGQEYRPGIEIVPAVLGVRAGAVGAAFLAAEELSTRSARVGDDER
jgi:glucokinase